MTLQGVNFKEGTADFTDESAPALKALGAMLKAHSDVKLRIEGYADGLRHRQRQDPARGVQGEERRATGRAGAALSD